MPFLITYYLNHGDTVFTNIIVLICRLHVYIVNKCSLFDITYLVFVGMIFTALSCYVHQQVMLCAACFMPAQALPLATLGLTLYGLLCNTDMIRDINPIYWRQLLTRNLTSWIITVYVLFVHKFYHGEFCSQHSTHSLSKHFIIATFNPIVFA